MRRAPGPPHWRGDLVTALLVLGVALLVFWWVPAPAHASPDPGHAAGTTLGRP
jgi:hypothetical protein